MVKLLVTIGSFVFSLLAIAALQYGYEFGPKWLFRQNDGPSLFVILAGTLSISLSFIVCMSSFAFEDDEDENEDEHEDDEDDSDRGYSEDKV